MRTGSRSSSGKLPSTSSLSKAVNVDQPIFEFIPSSDRFGVADKLKAYCLHDIIGYLGSSFEDLADRALKEYPTKRQNDAVAALCLEKILGAKC